MGAIILIAKPISFLHENQSSHQLLVLESLTPNSYCNFGIHF